MCRFSTVVGSAVPRKTIVGLVAMIATVVLLPGGVAAAQSTLTSNFDSFALGSINGQHGWRSGPADSPTGEWDQAVVPVMDFYPSVSGFGTQAWRYSNLYGSGTFSNQTFSPEHNPPATENGPDTRFIAQFSFITARTAEQPGLFVSISPDNGGGGRMFLVQLIDAATGTEVVVWDTTADGNFVEHPVAVLPRGVPHTIKIWIKLHPGEDNDVVGVYIDGNDVGQCFTTWENFSREDINSLLFRVAPTDFDETNGGYLFDNVTTTVDNGPGPPPECDVPVEKHASVRTVSPGGLVRYTITARNRGDATARNLLVCDRIPPEETFVSADHRLLRVGRRRCLVINNLAPGQHMSFHIVLRVSRNAPAGRIDNGSDETDGVEPPEPPLGPPAPPAVPGPPPAPMPDIPGHITVSKPKPEGGASVDVVRPTPAFTG